MKVWFSLFFCLLAFGNLSLANQPDPIEFDADLEEEGKEIEKLENELHKKTLEYNEKLAEKAAGSAPIAQAETTINKLSRESTHKGSSILEERVKALEQELIQLKNKQKKMSHVLTPAELEATKKAEEKAPLLAAATPALAQYNQAHGLLKNNELEKAKEAFQQIINNHSQDPYTAKSYLHLGDIHLQLKNFSEAEKAFKEALMSKLEIPLMVKARLGLAEALVHLNKPEDCCQQLKVLQKETLDDGQKKYLKDLLEKTNCQKTDQSKTEQSKTEQN